MKLANFYKYFKRDLSIEELQYNYLFWKSELEFSLMELVFLKKLIQSYPFNVKTFNLFERIQLLVAEIDKTENKNKILLEKTLKQNSQLQDMNECDSLSCDNYFMIEYMNLAEEIFENIESYKLLKTRIYQYMGGIMN